MAKKPTTQAPRIVEGAFTALGSILHNGDLYEAGQTIEDLTEAEAAALLAGQAIAVVMAPDKPAAQT